MPPKKIYSAKYFDVVEEEIKVKGKTKKISTVTRRPISVVLPLSPEKEVYLISQQRDFFKKRILEATAGHAEEGETPLAAAKRELKEETGISAATWEELVRVEGSASVIRSIHHIFIAQDLEFGTPSPDDDEKIELVKMPVKDAVSKVFSGEISTASTIIGILMLDKLRLNKRL